MGNPNTMDEESKNHDFVQLYRKFIVDVAELGMNNPGASVVFFFLVRNMDQTNAISVSMETIASFTHISRQTVSKHIKYLVDNGWIQILKIGRTSVYLINDSVVWTAAANEHSYCKFNATILAERSEGGDPWNVRERQKEFGRKGIRTIYPRALEEIQVPTTTTGANDGTGTETSAD